MTVHKIAKRTITVLLVLVLSLGALVSCEGGIDTEEAENMIFKFIIEIEAGNFYVADDYLHPSRSASLSTFFGKMESALGVDFQKGMDIGDKVATTYAYYTSEYDGSTYETTFPITVSKVKIMFTFLIVSDERGTGIYNIHVEA